MVEMLAAAATLFSCSITSVFELPSVSALGLDWFSASSVVGDLLRFCFFVGVPTFIESGDLSLMLVFLPSLGVEVVVSIVGMVSLFFFKCFVF